MSAPDGGCPLCHPGAEDVIRQDAFCRIILANDPNHPGLTRVILNRHVAEMTDLVPLERQRMMMTVMKVESALRDLLQPDKINLASLGNMVPHLHWHIVPRFRDDPHFPGGIWLPEGTPLNPQGSVRPLPANFRAKLQARLQAEQLPLPESPGQPETPR